MRQLWAVLDTSFHSTVLVCLSSLCVLQPRLTYHGSKLEANGNP